MLQPNSFGSTDGDGKAIVLNKLYDHSFHAFIRQESEQLVGEVTMPDSIINPCQIYKHGTNLSFCFITFHIVLSKQNSLIPVDLPLEIQTALQEQWINNRIYTGLDNLSRIL